MALERSTEAEPEAEVEVDEEEHTVHHPSAPFSELFDISTTVDPSYIISLIRKLLPPNVRNTNSHGVDVSGAFGQGSETGSKEESTAIISSAGHLNFTNNETEAMDTLDDLDGVDSQNKRDDSCQSSENPEVLAGEEAWEEYGCILWDLSASRTHAEFMVENLLLEVLLETLTVSESVRIKEISLGIIGNLACHEVPQARIVSMKGLVEIVTEQLFLDDSPCLSETCRLLTLGLQGKGSGTWIEALQPEHILGRILWITENTLNPQLLEKSIGLLLAILESQQEVAQILLPSLMKLGLPSLLVNLLAFEMGKLIGERIPERYPVLDLILRAIEALSVIDNYSQVISSNEELPPLVYELVKLPDKVEVASSCVTSVVLISNILTDAPGLAFEISQDLLFLQGLFGIFPLVTDDSEACSALWSVLARVLIQVKEDDLNPSNLHKYVSVLVESSDFIEEDLIDHQLEDSKDDRYSLSTSDIKFNVRMTALSKIVSILTHWTAATDDVARAEMGRDDHLDDGKVDKLLRVCRKYIT